MTAETPQDIIYRRIKDDWSALDKRLGFAARLDWLSLTDWQRIVDALEARSRAWLQENGAPEAVCFEYRNYRFWDWLTFTHDCSHEVNVLIMRTLAARGWGVDPSLVQATSRIKQATVIPLGKHGSRTASLADPLPAGDLATTRFYTPPHTLFQAKLEDDLQRHVMKALAALRRTPATGGLR